MTFSSLIGNSAAAELLQKIASAPFGPQVFLFEGPSGVGKSLFATAFAKALLGKRHVKKMEAGIHPDVFTFCPEGKTAMHSIASIRKILEEASYPPFEADKKVYIVEDVERMLPTSSNALLKTLEEPHAHLRFILLTSHPTEVLPTIASRCFKVAFSPIDEEAIISHLVEEKNLTHEEARQIALQSEGSMEKVFERLESMKDPIRKTFIEILQQYFGAPLSLDSTEALIKLDKLIEKHAASSPAKSIRLLDQLLGDWLFWLRDLHVLREIPSQGLYFASSHEYLIRQLDLGTLPSLEKGFALVDQARLSLQRSIKPKVVLEQLFSRSLCKKQWS